MQHLALSSFTKRGSVSFAKVTAGKGPWEYKAGPCLVKFEASEGVLALKDDSFSLLTKVMEMENWLVSIMLENGSAKNLTSAVKQDTRDFSPYLRCKVDANTKVLGEEGSLGSLGDLYRNRIVVPTMTIRCVYQNEHTYGLSLYVAECSLYKNMDDAIISCKIPSLETTDPQ